MRQVQVSGKVQKKVGKLPETIRLRILATSDIHAHLMPYDYYLDRETERFGLARVATLIAQSRAQADNTILIDNGDFLTGTPVSDPDSPTLAPNVPLAENIMVSTMNDLGYVAAALGNHEFNHGIDFLRWCAGQARFPFLCANIDLPEDMAPVWKTHVMIDQRVRTLDGMDRVLRIAIFGLAPPQSIKWDHSVLPPGMVAQDMVDTAQRLVPQLRAAGADVVIGLCHTGLGAAEHRPLMENALIPLSGVAGIDALIGGHSHEVFQGHLHGVPTVIPGFFGSHLGVIDLCLHRPHPAAVWQSIAPMAALVPVAAPDPETGSGHRIAAADPVILERAQTANAATLARMRQPFGVSQSPLHSYFALVAPDRTLAVVAQAQVRFAKDRLKASDHRLPLLSAVAPFRSGGQAGAGNYIDLPAGPLSYRNASELYQYPNYANIVEIDGAILLDWLERSAGQFLQIQAGQTEQPLINTGFPTYNFDVVHGVTYHIDPTQPARYHPDGTLLDATANRVGNLLHKGKPVLPQDKFLVVTNSYRTGGGGSFAMLSGAKLVLESRRTLREIVISHLQSCQGVLPEPGPVWRFRRMAKTSAQFDSGAGGQSHLRQDGPAAIRAIGPGHDGFWQYNYDFERP